MEEALNPASRGSACRDGHPTSLIDASDASSVTRAIARDISAWDAGAGTESAGRRTPGCTVFAPVA